MFYTSHKLRTFMLCSIPFKTVGWECTTLVTLSLWKCMECFHHTELGEKYQGTVPNQCVKIPNFLPYGSKGYHRLQSQKREDA